jgi:serine/threonine-protein kinase RsbW
LKVLAALKNGTLAAELTAQGNEVITVNTVEELDAQLSAEPAFMVVDPSLGCACDLVVRVKSRIDGPDRDRLPVIAVGAPSPTDPYCVPDAALNSANADELLDAAQGIIMRRARQRRLFDQEMILKVPTIPDAVEKAGDILEQFVAAANYSEEEGVKLQTTIREAVGNAAEHGNKNSPDRTIHINFLRSSDRLAVVVTDEGPGFDTSAFLSRADEVSALEHTRSRRSNEARPGGLGVFIMKETCDEITFNQAGNSIYLMKYLPGREP